MKGEKTKIRRLDELPIEDLLKLEAAYSRHMSYLEKLRRAGTTEYEHLRSCQKTVQLWMLEGRDEDVHLGGSHGRNCS